MRRRLVVWFAVVATTLVVVSSPVSATAVASVNETDTDFQNAVTNEWSISGSGEPAYIETNLNWSSTNSDPTMGFSSVSSPAKRGLVFSSSRDADTVTATISSGSNPDTAYLRTDAGSTIDTVPISSGVATFTGVDIEAGTNYRVELADPDASFGGEWSAEFDENYGGSDNGIVNIKSGSESGSDASDLYAITSLEVGSSSSSAVYEGQTHTVSGASSAFVNISQLSNAELTVEALGKTGNSWSVLNTTTVSSSGTARVGVSTSATELRVRITASATGSGSNVRVGAEGYEFDPSAPVLSGADPSDRENVGDYSGVISINLTDPDLGTAQGDSVTVNATTAGGSEISSTSANTNETVSFSYSPVPGENEIKWTATDSYGETVSVWTNWTAPSTLTFYNESAPDQVIGNVEVTIRYFEPGGDTVVQSTANDGTANLSALPKAGEFVVFAQADGYYSRRIVIDSLFEQQSVYLLSNNETARFNRFELDDKSGDYPPEATKLIVQRSLTKDFDDDGSNETRWVRIGADYLGAQNRYPIDLEEGEVFRLKVEKSDESTALTLGRYIPRQDEIVTLTIGTITFDAPSGSEYYMIKQLDPKTNELQLQYTDEAGLTENVSVTVVERGNESNVLFTDDVANPSKTETWVIGLNENQTDKTWKVEWSGTRNGTVVSEATLSGGNAAPLPIDSKWMGSLIFLFVLSFGALGGERLATIYAIGMTSIAGIAMLFQWVDIAVPFWWAMAIISVFGHIALNTRRGV